MEIKIITNFIFCGDARENTDCLITTRILKSHFSQLQAVVSHSCYIFAALEIAFRLLRKHHPILAALTSNYTFHRMQHLNNLIWSAKCPWPAQYTLSSAPGIKLNARNSFFRLQSTLARIFMNPWGNYRECLVMVGMHKHTKFAYLFHRCHRKSYSQANKLGSYYIWNASYPFWCIQRSAKHFVYECFALEDYLFLLLFLHSFSLRP